MTESARPNPASLPPASPEAFALLERRLRRSEAAREAAEGLLERRARELDRSNRDLRQRESELLARLDLGNRHLLNAQRTARIGTIYRDRGEAFVVSPEFQQIIGLSGATPVTPVNVMMAVHPLDRRRIERANSAFYLQQYPGTEHQYEHRIIKPESGEIRWLRWTLRREVDAQGALVSVAGTVQDITDQRASDRRSRAHSLISERRVRELSRLADELSQATAQLEENTSFLRAVLDTVPQGIAVFDGQLCLAAWNSQLADLTEIAPGDLSRGLPFDAFAALHWRHDPAAQADRLKRDAAGRIIDQRFGQRLSDGRSVEVVVVSRGDAGMVKTYTDVTQYKAIERALRHESDELADRVGELEFLSDELRRSNGEIEQANRSKSQFLAMMSHDIRTPLNGVLGMMALLGETSLDDGQRRQLNLARQSGDQLRLLLDDILEIVRAEAGKIELAPEPVDLSRTVPAIVDFWSAATDGGPLTIEGHVAPTLTHPVMLDPTRFRQLLDNLISNAIKYTPAGRVAISAGLHDGRLRFEVDDTGPGIADELRPELFNDFRRLRTMAPDAAPGAGLGLAICRRLVDAMDGTIGVDSEVGNGSCFWFELPMIRAAADVAPKPAPSIEGLRAADGRRPYLLIVEDVETNRLVLGSMLELLGCDYAIAVNGAEAVAAVAATRFDAVLMDVQMPVMDGAEATRAIRALAGDERNVPIVGVTAHALRSERAALLALGMNACLSKPIEMGQLRTLIDEALTGQTPDMAPPVLIDLPAFDALFQALPPHRRAAMLSSAVTDLRQLGAELTEAMARDDGEAASRAAHSLKGAAANIGALAVADAAARWRETPAATVAEQVTATIALCQALLDELPGGQ